MTLKVIDMLPGSGKTTLMCRYLAGLDNNERFIYITPYVDEVDKIEQQIFEDGLNELQHDAYVYIGGYKKEDFGTNFPYAPKEEFHKCKGALKVLYRKKNLICSHALFIMLVKTKAFWKFVQEGQYRLIIDEELNLEQDYDFNKTNCSATDIKCYLMRPIGEDEAYLKVEDSGKLIWNSRKGSSTNKAFKRFAKDVKTGCLVYDKSWFRWRVPIDKFGLFKDVLIMTYRFKWSLFRLVWGDDWEYWHFEDGSLVAGEWQIPKEMARYIAIHMAIAQRRHYSNLPYRKHYPFSLSWFEDAEDEDLRVIVNDIRKWIRFGAAGRRLDRKRLIWTTFKKFRSRIETIDDEGTESFRPKKKDCFVPLNVRASNDYLDCNIVVYLVDRHLGGTSEVDRDEWSLSELLQLIFRTALRDQSSGQFVYIWVPSERMWNLLNDWWGEMWRIGTEGGEDPITKEEVDREKAR